MKNILTIIICFLSYSILSQNLPSMYIANSTIWGGCDSTVNASIFIGSVNASNNSELDLVISQNQSTTPNFGIVLSINWGDGTTSTHQGSGNFMNIGQAVVMNPEIEHTYQNFGAYQILISYTGTNASSPSGNLNYTYNYNCGLNNSYLYASANVDCDQNGQVDYTLNDSIPIIITTPNGLSVSTTIYNGQAQFSIPSTISGSQLTYTIDSSWLAENNYAVSGSPLIISTNPNGIYQAVFNLICTGVPDCSTTTTSIVQGYLSGSLTTLVYSTSTPNQIATYSWSISSFDVFGNEIGTPLFSTQANAYLTNNPEVNSVQACLTAVFNNGCIDTICETFSLDNCISGILFCDANGNNILDSTENTISNAAIQIQAGGATQTIYSDINGFYSYTYSSNSPIILALNQNWLSTLGYSTNFNLVTLLSQNCDSNQTFNIAINCGNSSPSTYCLGGVVFCDGNGNGQFDSNELPLSNAPIAIYGSTSAVSSGVNITVYSDSNGVFQYCGPISNTQPGTNNVVIASILQSWLLANGYSMNSTYIPIYVSTSPNINTALFPVNCGGTSNVCADLWTTVTPWIGYYQGTVATVKLNWGNYGPGSPGGYTLTMTYPAGVTVNTSSIQNTGYTMSGNTITWNLNSALSFFTMFDNITFNVPIGLPSGTPHYFTSTITPNGTLTDCSTLNNNGSLLQILGNSYDPNDKLVARPEETQQMFPADLSFLNPDVVEKLNYTIRFQNTGTAPAQNIYIIDTLSANLDWTSFSLIESSHPMQVISLGNGVLRFEFSQIWLPDSTTNEEESHGHFVYSINEIASLQPGQDAIENTAYIFFDWNEPIVTNTTFNINMIEGSLEEETTTNFKIFPNPAATELNILTDGSFSYQISDMSGRVVLKGEANEVANLSILELNSGMYSISCFTQNEIKTLRFMKQ